MPPVKYWEIIADRLHAEGWSYGIAEHFTEHGLLFCVDAHRNGKRFIVKADDLLTAFLSLERDAMENANGNATPQNVVGVRHASFEHWPVLKAKPANQKRLACERINV